MIRRLLAWLRNLLGIDNVQDADPSLWEHLGSGVFRDPRTGDMSISTPTGPCWIQGRGKQ